MSYYRTCPKCGAALDPGETCECEREQVRAEADALREEINGLMETADALHLRTIYGFMYGYLKS